MKISMVEESPGLNLEINTFDTPPNATNDTREEVPPRDPNSPTRSRPSLVKPSEKAAANQHGEEKTPLIDGGVAVGLAALWLSMRLTRC